MGYAALIQRFDLRVPPLRHEFVATERSVESRTTAPDGTERTELPRRRITDPDTLVGQLTFALKREDLNLTVLAALFERTDARQQVQAWLQGKPSSRYARQAACLGHWLSGVVFDYSLPPGSPRVRLLDEKRYVTGPAVPNARFGVVNNLLGTSAFSPLVRRTESLQALLNEGLAQKARSALDGIEPEMLARAADYLYLAETRSTYSIEDEVPDNNRAARFRRLLHNAGRPGRITEEQLCDWQNQIVNPLQAEFHYRHRQNWLSRPGRSSSIADFIPPAPADVHAMMDGVATVAGYATEGMLDPVVAASCAAFGLVYVHPFLDGNGRLHRFLLHHILRQSGFTPAGVVLPLSARMLKQVHRYATLLKRYSRPRTGMLNYQLDSDSDTIFVEPPQPLWLYAYPDATESCEFVLECCKLSVEEDLLSEVMYLRAHDQTVRALETWLDMRQSQLNTLISVIVQGHGTLSRRKRRLAGPLTDEQLTRVEQTVSQFFAGYMDARR